MDKLRKMFINDDEKHKEAWKLQYVNRKINHQLFKSKLEAWADQSYSNYLFRYAKGESEVRVELDVSCNGEDRVNAIEINKAMFNEYGPIYSIDISKRDYAKARTLLSEVMPLRGTEKIVDLINLSIQNNSESEGFKPIRNNEKSVTFLTPDHGKRILKISNLEKAYDLVYTYPDICRNISVLAVFSPLLGEHNINMVFAILKNVVDPQKLKDDYEYSLPQKEQPVRREMEEPVEFDLTEPQNEELLDEIRSWIEAKEALGLIDLIYSVFTTIHLYDGFLEESIFTLMIENLKSLEAGRDRDIWASYAFGYLVACKKAESIINKADSLVYIYNFARTKFSTIGQYPGFWMAFDDLFPKEIDKEIKANQIMSLQQEATMESNKDIEYKLEIPREAVRLINLLKEEPVLAAIKGRKKIKFPHRTFREKADRSASFKCPFCSESNEVNGHNCKHVVYGYETVNYLVVCMNEEFYDVIIKLISSDPTYYVEDFEYFFEEYLDTLDFIDGQKVEIDLKAYKIVLKDRISPDVLESVINKNGIPIMMKSLLEYSLYSDYIGGGTYYYLVSDDDLINLATYQARQ